MTDDQITGDQCVDALALIAKQFDAAHATSARGSVECPRCNGRLEYTASKTTHSRRLVIRAKCQTPACMEFLT